MTDPTPAPELAPWVRPPMRLVYIVGPPGVGKSTLMAELTRRAVLVGSANRPIPIIRWEGPDGFACAELGRRRTHFSGTDAMAMNIQPRAVEWMAGDGKGWPLVLGEGDRLGNRKFLEAVGALGWSVSLIYLDLALHALEARHRERGADQSEAWRKGRHTKALNVARWATATGRIDTTFLDAGATPDALAARARSYIPLLARLA